MGMSASASHANNATTELLGLSAQQRIRAIRSERWVGYPRVQKTLQILEQILDHPRTTRMPSIAIFGDSGMGKTMLMRKFCADHPPGVDAETERHRTPVLALQMTRRAGPESVASMLKSLTRSERLTIRARASSMPSAPR